MRSLGILGATGKFEFADKAVNDDALKEKRTNAYVDVSLSIKENTIR